ncbi:MAG TPA: VOC family protein [candidate division Zixibacteria bacterium]|nr:VOC family protein [candidate division Zixibacteria bacterium]
MKCKKIVSTWLHSTDLERTKVFMAKLGMSCIISNETLVVFAYPDGGPNTAYYLYPEPLNDGAPIRKGGVFAIEVDDIAAFLQQCKENNIISPDAEIYAQERFISFLLNDPDENLFEIIQQKE